MAKGLYQSVTDEKLIVFVYEIADGDAVIYTEALHPVGVHYASVPHFKEKFKKVHKIEFAESEE